MKKIIKFLSLVLIIVSLGSVSVEANSNPERIAGDDRIRTAIEVSKKAYPRANKVVLAGYEGEVDALSGTILAYSQKAPMLLTKKDKLHDLTLKEIERLKPSEIYILGGESVVSKAVEKSLSKYKVTRVGDKKREGTAVDVAQIVKGKKIDEVFLTLGYDEYADALAVGPISARQNKPILLTKTGKLPDTTKKALKEFGVSKVTIIGGEGVVSKGVEKELTAMKIGVNRVFGKNRMETALNIAKEYTGNSSSVIVANGYKYADAVVGGYFAAMENAPILLSRDKVINNDNLNYIAANKAKTYLIGGENVINKDVARDINIALKDPIEIRGLSIEGPNESFSSHKIKVETNIVNEVVYKFYVKDESSSQWTVLQDYTKNNTLNWIPQKEGNYQYKVEAKYEGSKIIGAESQNKVKIEPLKPAKISSVELQGNRYEKNQQIIAAEASGTNTVLYKFFIQDRKTGKWSVLQDYSENKTAKWTPAKHGEYRYTVRVKDINSSKDYDDLLGQNLTINPPINYVTSHYNYTFEYAVSKQTGTKETGSNKIPAPKEEIIKYLNPKNFLQFEATGSNRQEKPLIAVESKINGLNVRSQPNTGSKIVAKLEKNDVYIVLDEKNGWYKINAKNKTTFKDTIGWISGDYAEYVNDVPKDMYQFMVLSGQAGVTVAQMNKELKGMGILEGHGAAFIEGSKLYNVNELYLMSHSFLETGRGKSPLSIGIKVDTVDGKPVTPRVVYNMYGIGAKNQDPDRLGSETAYKEGWFTPEIAIREGAKWISEGYINNPEHKQDTLYKMRFYPDNLGHWHKYATDIAWAYKQTSKISEIMEYGKNMEGIVLRFDIPKYK